MTTTTQDETIETPADALDGAASPCDDAACGPAIDAPLVLDRDEAETFAGWFSTLSDPTRVRLLHAVSTAPAGHIRIGDLALELGIGQPTVTHHVQKLAEVGFLNVDRVGTSKHVSVNPACCTGLPHAADVVMGTLAARPCCPEDLPADVTTRALTDDDLPVVRDIYAEGIATRNATFETEVPDASTMATKWLPGHRLGRRGYRRVTGSSAGRRSRRSPSARATPASVRPRCTSPSRPAVAAWARRCF